MIDYNTIRTLLDTNLKTVVGLPQLATENIRVTTTNAMPWCRSTLITSEPSPLTVGYDGMNQHKGIYQVDLFYPQDYGTTDVSAISKLVINAFPRGLTLTDGTTNIHVTMTWQLTAYTVQQAWYAVPVSIRWSSFK
jgi:hypothetical protein